MLFSNLNARKNTQRLLNICSDLIEKYEKFNAKLAPSCKADLYSHIKKELDQAQKEIAEWQDYDTDYIKIAHTLLTHHTFDMLASGRYHLYYGILNPMNCSSNLMTVYNKSMEWGVEHGLLTDSEKEEQLRYLIKRISQVG